MTDYGLVSFAVPGERAAYFHHIGRRDAVMAAKRQAAECEAAQRRK